MHVQLTTSGTPSQADCDAYLTTFQNNFKTRFQSQLPTDYTFNYAKMVVYIPGGLEVVSTVTPTAWSGTGASVSPSGPTCSVLSWQTSVYWRGGKPRTYFPAINNVITAGTDNLTSAFRTSLAAAGVSFRTDVNAITSGAITGSSFGFISFRSGNAERGTPLFFSIGGAIVHPRVGTQRRRAGKWQN